MYVLIAGAGHDSPEFVAPAITASSLPDGEARLRSRLQLSRGPWGARCGSLRPGSINLDEEKKHHLNPEFTARVACEVFLGTRFDTNDWIYS